jgi:diacylglycerol kinase
LGRSTVQDSTLRRLGIRLPQLPDWLGLGLQSWHDTKIFFEHSTSVDHDSLHLLVGALVWVLCAVISRRPLRSWLPLACVFLIILINEAVDFWVEIWPEEAMQLGEGAKDLMMTMAVPVVLFAALRIFPWLGTNRQR